MIKDSVTQSIIKAITWRVTATLTTILLVFAITGTLKTALSIGALETISKIVLYYLHERIWVQFQSRGEAYR